VTDLAEATCRLTADSMKETLAEQLVCQLSSGSRWILGCLQAGAVSGCNDHCDDMAAGSVAVSALPYSQACCRSDWGGCQRGPLSRTRVLSRPLKILALHGISRSPTRTVCSRPWREHCDKRGCMNEPLQHAGPQGLRENQRKRWHDVCLRRAMLICCRQRHGLQV
jgi:hypothetical protein